MCEATANSVDLLVGRHELIEVQRSLCVDREMSDVVSLHVDVYALISAKAPCRVNYCNELQAVDFD